MRLFEEPDRLFRVILGRRDLPETGEGASPHLDVPLAGKPRIDLTRRVELAQPERKFRIDERVVELRRVGLPEQCRRCDAEPVRERVDDLK